MTAERSRENRRSALDWGAVSEAYANPGESLVAIARRFGISRSTLSRRARQEGWPPRRERKAKSSPQVVPKARGYLSARIRRALTAQIAEVEARLAHGEFASNPAQSERDARALGILTRTLEKLASVESAEADRATDLWHDYDRERALKNVEDRLAGLARARNEKDISGASDGG